ncbi:MAG TPA: peptidylprolyl isomerase, partial [Candidatus Polarisedimenticolia bacterium]|nr:peptidylprolyl isomerase [Candidatus Polarisedimenticolia bacterium]
VEKLFGASFAKELVALPTGEWAGPVRSASGAHLVRLSSRSEKRVPPFAEVKDAVHRAWTAARRAQARDEYFDQTLKRYRVNVEAAR